MTQIVQLTVAPAAEPYAFTVNDDDGQVFSFEVAPDPAPVQLLVVGEAGPIGPPGSTVEVYPFPTAAATWTVTHNLGRYPLVQVVISDGTQWDADIDYPDLNTVVITHSRPLAGSVLIV